MGTVFIEDIKYITNLKSEQYDPDNSSYIISRDDLRIIMNDICNRLKHPITIININYNGIPYLEGRVDSDASYYAIRPTCRNLRIAAGEYYCMKCDDYYSKYCKDLIEKKVCDVAPPDYFAGICKENPPTLRQKEDVNFLTYDCPMLGYCEMCFPIHFYHKIVGFFVVGEILLKDTFEHRNEIIDDFFGKQDLRNSNSIFSKYAKRWEKEHPNCTFSTNCMKEDTNISNGILEDYNQNESLNQNDYKNYLKQEEFELLISKCCSEVKRLEKTLENEWDRKKQQYFEKIVNDIRKNFNLKYNAIREQEEIAYSKVQEIFDVIWDAVISLKKIFRFDYCRLYDNLPYISGRESGHSINEIGEVPYNTQDLTCDFTKVNLSMSQCKSSLENKNDNNPLLCFTNDLQEMRKSNVALACENLVVLFGVSGCYSLKSKIDLKYLKILFKEIGKLFLHMCADLERISTLFMQQQHEKTLHMYRHECAHLAQRIQQNNQYYSDRERYESLSAEKKDNIYKDINSTALLLQHLSENIGLLLGTAEKKALNYSRVDVRNEFNKWRAMYRLELRKKNLRIYNNTASLYSNLIFNTDGEMFDIMLFNLIDNAVKYSHWGTNIVVEATPDQVIVRNYGIKIENSNRPYDLYYRDKENVQNNLGDGIGLYSSRRVAEILKLNLYHTCEKISDYNVSYVHEAAIRGMSPDHIDFVTAVQQLKKINKREILTPKDYYEGSDYNSIPQETLYRHMNIPTYCVTFIIAGFEIQK